MTRSFRDLDHFYLPTEDTVPEVVILANGDFPRHPLPVALLKNAQRVICCDGAANEYFNHGLTPELIVGDGDSISPEIKKRFTINVYYSADEQINDLTKAVDYCLSQQVKSIYILGATGKREDHTIGNISLLYEYMDKFKEVMIVSDYGVFTPFKTDALFESYVGQPISVFTASHGAIRSRGLKYPLSPIKHWWQGTLNEAIANPFTLFVRDKTILYRAFESKK